MCFSKTYTVFKVFHGHFNLLTCIRLHMGDGVVLTLDFSIQNCCLLVINLLKFKKYKILPTSNVL